MSSISTADIVLVEEFDGDRQRKFPVRTDIMGKKKMKELKKKVKPKRLNNYLAKKINRPLQSYLPDELGEMAEEFPMAVPAGRESPMVDVASLGVPEQQRFAVFPCTLLSDTHIVLVRPESRLQLFGSFEMQALFGDVSVNGFLCKAGPANDERWLSVVAPWASAPPVCIKCPLASSCSKAPKRSRLQHRLKLLTDEEKIKEVMNEYEPGFSVILLRTHLPPACSLIKEMYGLHFFKPPLVNSDPAFIHINKTCCIPKHRLPDNYHDQLRADIDGLCVAIREKADNHLHSVTAILGTKGAGKSTLARLLSNILIRKDFPPVYLLDTDVGQCETTPSGCVSLIKLDKPLLGVASTNQRMTFTETYFFGDTSPATMSRRYLAAIRTLVDSFRENAPPGSSLIVNTHGWLSGKGIELMRQILETLEVNFVFHLHSVSDNDEFDSQRLPETCEEYWQPDRPLSVRLPGPAPNSAQLRDMQMTAYLSALVAVDSATVAAVVDVAPLAVRWGSVGVWMPPDCLSPDDQIMNVLNASIVALCRVDKDKLTKRFLDDKSLPFRLDSADESPLRCVGFGLIRAIDMEQKLFFVLTPVDRDVLLTVNVFARGIDIDLPSAFLFAQSTPTPAPYVVRPQNIKAPTDFHGFHKALQPVAGYKRSRRAYK